jgi:predicted Zn-dependent peptidase
MKINRAVLSNGLRVVHSENTATQMVTVNITYNVGSKDENPSQTGLAHLIEHLMFGGTERVPDYDRMVERCGGENNAWTNTDFTNFYACVPWQNAEMAFFLESDRMRGLRYSQERLDNQKSVVIEEFKQRDLNRPYGDILALLYDLVYKVHPYRWQTIGKDVSHIESVSLHDVKDFVSRFYMPSNAVLSVVGNISFERVLSLADKYFASIEGGVAPVRALPMEPPQEECRRLEVRRSVPNDVLYMAFRMCGRLGKDYYVADLISDILANGSSSRLLQVLHKKMNLATRIDAYLSGRLDDGIMFFYAYPAEGVSLSVLEEEIERQLEVLRNEPVSERELAKLKNKFESSRMFSTLDCLDLASDLSCYEMAGIDYQGDLAAYCAVTADDVIRVSREIFRQSNKSVLYYYSDKSKT